MKTFWISMAPPSGKGRTVLVDAENSHRANLKVHQLGLYRPGDEFYIIELPSHAVEYSLPRDRVCTEEELRAVGAGTLGELLEQQMQVIAVDIGVFNPDKSN